MTSNQTQKRIAEGGPQKNSCAAVLALAVVAVAGYVFTIAHLTAGWMTRYGQDQQPESRAAVLTLAVVAVAGYIFTVADLTAGCVARNGHDQPPQALQQQPLELPQQSNSSSAEASVCSLTSNCCF